MSWCRGTTTLLAAVVRSSVLLMHLGVLNRRTSYCRTTARSIICRSRTGAEFLIVLTCTVVLSNC
jgi:hypothetical protein